MDPLSSGLFVGLILLAIFVSSLLARIFKAKRHKIYWVIMPWLLAVFAIIASNIYQLDGLFALGVGIGTFLVMLKLISGLEVLTSLTVTVASIAMLGLGLAGGVLVLNRAAGDSNEFVSTAVSFIPTSQYYDLSFLGREKQTREELIASAVEEEEMLLSDKDLLDSLDLKPKEKRLAAKEFQEVSPRKAAAMRGSRVRLLKHNGDLVKGNIVGLNGNNLIISKSVTDKGVIKAPIPIASIKKLEVYY